MHLLKKTVLKNTFRLLFIALFVACTSNDTENTIPTTAKNLAGQWQLVATYISPGGASEWKEVENGFSYTFKDDGTYLMTTSENVIEQSGVFRFENEEIFMDFNSEGEAKTLGYIMELKATELTLSPSFPAICFEGCFYRFKKK